MLTDTSPASPFDASNKTLVVYMRFKIVGHEQLARIKHTITHYGEALGHDTPDDVTWVYPVDKEGKPIGNRVYDVDPRGLIHSQLVKQDIMETTKGKE